MIDWRVTNSASVPSGSTRLSLYEQKHVIA